MSGSNRLCAHTGEGGIPHCRHELYHIQRELLRERTHCKALEEELENPMNIHRWRKLEVSPVLSVPMHSKPTNLPPPTAGQ